MKIFQLNDFEWWMAPTIEDAMAAACAEWGETMQRAKADGMLDEPHELTDHELDTLKYHDLDERERPVNPRSFRAELAARIASGNVASQLFATTEF